MVSPLCANTTNTQNSINKTRSANSKNCRNRTVEKNRDPEYLVLQKLKHLIASWKNFQKIYQPNNLNVKRNLLLKISHSQTLKLLNEYVRNRLLKIIRTTPQALNKCVRNRLLTIIRTTNFEQLFSNYFEIIEYHVAQSTLKDYPPRIILTALLRFVEKKDPWFERKQ